MIHLASNDSEVQVIGSIFLKQELLDEMFLKEEYFYDSRHKKIIWLMKEMLTKGMDIDAVSLVSFAAQQRLIEDIGGLAYITRELQVPSASNFVYHQNVILEQYKKREQVLMAQKILSSVLQNEAVETTSEALKRLAYIEGISGANEDDGHISKVMSNVYHKLIQDKEHNYSKTHFDQLDTILDGLKRQDLFILGARPSMGKTAFAMNVAQNHALKNKGPVLVFSIEMPSDGVGMRIVSSESMVASDKLKNTDRMDSKDWDKVVGSIGLMSDTKMHMFDDSSVPIDFIRRKTKTVAAKYPGEHLVVLIDYLQLIQGDRKHGGNRNAEISEISRELKRVARETNSTVIALSQLSRLVEQRQDKRPMMSDLRESGQIEQDADVIAFLYRDDYYDSNSEAKGMIEVIVAKNRQGGIGTATLAFKKELSKFINIG